MAGQLTRRLVTGGVLALLGTATVALGPTPALADDHDYLTVTGVDLNEPLTATASEHPEWYAALRTEVDWLVDRAADAPEPDQHALGPQYTLVLHVGGEARHRFHLYPLAEGGPRVFRPAEQPGDRSVREAWFFGRLSLPDTLRDAGVPLTGHPATASGGLGGGEVHPRGTARADSGALGFIEEWRRGMLLTLGLSVALLAGVASVAFLLRREPGRPRR